MPVLALIVLLLGGIVPAALAEPDADDPWALQREIMVRRQIASRGVEDERVLAALRCVPRHRFVPAELAGLAYSDQALPVGEGQTISQPYIVGLMTALLELEPDDRVLEIGTGSGYQAAVLAELCAEVYSIEIVATLGRRARTLLAALGVANVHLRIGDGYRGWPEQAPFDAIVVTAAPDHVPSALLEQLAPGGRLVIPVGAENQQLERHRRLLVDGPAGARYTRESVIAVRFVPMTGEALAR